VRIAAPFGAMVAAMSSVPDEVFANNVVGHGVALIPPVGADTIEVCAPVSGTVTAVFPHAFSIDVGDSRNVLVHLGIDTVELRGDGFDLRIAQGDEVTVGQVLISWDMRVAAQSGYALHCPVIAVQVEQDALDVVAQPGTEVVAGQTLAVWLR